MISGERSDGRGARHGSPAQRTGTLAAKPPIHAVLRSTTGGPLGPWFCLHHNSIDGAIRGRCPSGSETTTARAPTASTHRVIAGTCPFLKPYGRPSIDPKCETGQSWKIPPVLARGGPSLQLGPPFPQGPPCPPRPRGEKECLAHPCGRNHHVAMGETAPPTANSSAATHSLSSGIADALG